jgi:hypothetical protein
MIQMAGDVFDHGRSVGITESPRFHHPAIGQSQAKCVWAVTGVAYAVQRRRLGNPRVERPQ